jgi:hypothetical protein
MGEGREWCVKCRHATSSFPPQRDAPPNPVQGRCSRPRYPKNQLGHVGTACLQPGKPELESWVEKRQWTADSCRMSLSGSTCNSRFNGTTVPHWPCKSATSPSELFLKSKRREKKGENVSCKKKKKKKKKKKHPTEDAQHRRQNRPRQPKKVSLRLDKKMVVRRSINVLQSGFSIQNKR